MSLAETEAMDSGHPTAAHPRPIGLLTDFGLSDWYVGAMKCEILRRAPAASIVDLCHHVPPQSVETGAFMLECLLPSLPAGMVLCCVVDPGVGTERRGVCGRIGAWYFSGPDNGLAEPLLARAEGVVELFEIERAEFRATQVSSTFHGRDLFAPAAAALAGGAEPARAGRPARDPRRIGLARPRETERGIYGAVMLVDRFGNLVTNIDRATCERRLTDGMFELRAGNLVLREIGTAYGDARRGEPLAYWGSVGMLEIGVNMGSAALTTGLGVGESIEAMRL